MEGQLSKIKLYFNVLYYLKSLVLLKNKINNYYVWKVMGVCLSKKLKKNKE